MTVTTPLIMSPQSEWYSTGRGRVIRSTELGELAAALAAAQAEFSAIPKGDTNPFFKSKYASLPDVVFAASPILGNHSLAVTHLPGFDTDSNGNVFDTLTVLILHKSGQYLGGTMQLRPVKNDPQAQGSATTYGRRYSYMSALNLVADEDDDGNAGSAGRRSSQKPTPARRGNSTTPAADALSKADNASQDTAKPADGTGLVTEETLATLAEKYRATGVTKDQMRTIVAEAGGDAKHMDQLTEDQASWVVIKLIEIEGQKSAQAA